MNHTRAWHCLLHLLAAAAAIAQTVSAQVRPGPEHAALARFAGSWDVTFEVIGPEGVARSTNAQSEVVVAYGGFWLVEDVHGTFAGAPFAGHGVLGFDPSRQVCVRTWIDGMVPAPMQTEGTFDVDGKVLTMQGTGPDLHGLPAKVHSVFIWLDRDHGAGDVQMTAADGNKTRLRVVYARRPAETQRERIASIAAQLVDADYSGDLAALAAARERLPDPATVADAADADAVRYWRGFGAWRRANNRMNATDYDRELALSDLNAALADFDAVVAGPFFANCASASAGCLMALMFIDGREHVEFANRAKRAADLLEAAVAAAPDDPRVLWIQGGRQMWIPAAAGGGRERALATFTRGLVAARAAAASVTTENARQVASSLLPRWGEPELVAAIASAWSTLEPRDIERAEQFARLALAMRPDWRYARVTLLPAILAQSAK
ncbi:MAG: DUF1579 family protein [Planctomycetota bacterium]